LAQGCLGLTDADILPRLKIVGFLGGLATLERFTIAAPHEGSPSQDVLPRLSDLHSEYGGGCHDPNYAERQLRAVASAFACRSAILVV
jgi:hypothetical protein